MRSLLETPQERVKLLKAGVSGKAIEKLYLVNNNFKIVGYPVVIELVEVYTEENRRSTITLGTAIESS